jgi:hypothetical protein
MGPIIAVSEENIIAGVNGGDRGNGFTGGTKGTETNGGHLWDGSVTLKLVDASVTALRAASIE